MAKKPGREISPCKMKGRDLGSSGSGRLYALVDGSTGRRLHYSGCECAEAFVCASSKRVVERIAYAMDEDGRSIRLAHESEAQPPLLLTLPCRETFLKQDSEGTLRHSSAHGEMSSFSGCYDVERFLLERKLLRYEARETNGASLDLLEAHEIRGQLSDFDETSPETFLGYFVDGSRRELSLSEMHECVIDAHAWQKRVERETKQATHEARSHEAERSDRQGDEEDRSQSERLVEHLLEALTTKQRNAIRAVFLENPEKLPRRLIARRMGIREDSLGERIQGAFRKLRTLFPELVQKQHPKPRRPSSTGEKIDGEASRSSKLPLKLRAGVDVEAVKRAAREWEAARMAFETSWMRRP